MLSTRCGSRICAAAPQVDVVYVAMVHTGHMGAALQMIAGGKHVLVEKPMAMNYAEAAEMVEAAKRQVCRRRLLSPFIQFWCRPAAL